MFLLSDILAFSSPDIPPEASIRFVSWPGQPSCLVVRGVEAGGGVWELGESSRQVVTGLVQDAALGPGAQLLVLDASGTVRRRLIPGTDDSAPVGKGFDGWAARVETTRSGGAWQLAVMPDGSAWRAGAAESVREDGRRQPVPGGVSGGMIPTAADPYGNLWAARGIGPDGGAAFLAVLPFGNRTNWLPVAGCPIRPDAPTIWVVADDVGGIWVSDGTALFRTDPRQGGGAWTRAGDTLPSSRIGITALGVAADGAALAGFASGEVGVCDVDAAGRAVYRCLLDGRGVAVRAVHADNAGNTWMVRGTALERVGPTEGAWQRRWRAAGRLPCGNHDLTTAVLDNVCYLAGGVALSCGYPVAEKRVLDGVLAYDASRCLWTERARLSPGRAGAGLAGLNGKLWIVNGHAASAKGLSATRTVDIFDPADGSFSRGPDTRHERFFAVAAFIGGRVYAIGGGAYGKPARAVVESIAPGETVWRDEGEAPCALGAPVGCAYRERLFVHVPSAGLLSFDPSIRAWHTDLARPPRGFRSPQIAVYENRLWFVGGRDTPTEMDVFSYDDKTAVWRAEAPAPRPCAWGAAVSLRGRLYIHGGAIGRCCSDRTFVLNDEPGEKK